MAKNTQYTKANGYRVSQKTPWGHPVVYLLSVILVAICTVPVLYIIIGGFRTNSQITNNPSGLPDPWVIQNYVNVAQSDTFWVELKNSLIVAIFTMLGVVVLGIMVSYVIARYKFKYAPLMYSLFSAGLMFPMTVGITPLYLMIRNLARLTDAQLFISHGIERIRSEAVSSENGIDTIRLDRLDPAFPRDFVIYELLSSAYGFKGDVVDALCHALGQEDSTGKRFYARERVACIDRGKIVVAPIAADDPCLSTIAKGAPRAYCANAVLYFERLDIDAIKTFGVPEHIAQLDADRLQYPLTLRRWREGDWFVPFGMTGRKKVSDFLIDAKVSAPEKQRQFVLLSGDDIVWLVGRRIDDRYRLTSGTENVLRITKEIV